jgi:hypothetical protein
MIRYLILIIVGFMLGACAHKNDEKTKLAINVEIIGSWRNESGCVASFAKADDKLVLTSFADGKEHNFSNLPLLTKKESIMSTFKSQNPEINFNGNFLEGVIIINNYCTEPLHKVDKQ